MNQELNIYLIRGLTRESGHWGDFVDMLQSNIPKSKIHLIDMPGAGKNINESASIKISKMVDFMRKEVVTEIKSNSNNIVCATSLGGMLACDWALRYKNDFQGLIIIGSSFKRICTTKERVQKSVRWKMLKILLSNSIEKRERLIIEVNSNKPEIYESLAREWSEIQRLRKMSKKSILKHTIAGFLYGPKKMKPEIPLLIIGSKSDRLVCPNCIKKIHDTFGGTLIWHPTSGHGIPIDEPKWLSDQISNWCQTTFL
jgi:pimeloyl-ACP methyl ester carboxylesterase